MLDRKWMLERGDRLDREQRDRHRRLIREQDEHYQRRDAKWERERGESSFDWWLLVWGISGAAIGLVIVLGSLTIGHYLMRWLG